MALWVTVGAAEHHRGGARTESEGGELSPEVVGGGVLAGEPVEGDLLGMARALGVDDQRIIGLSVVDHRTGELDRVDESEAGVGQIKVEAAGGEVELVMHRDGGRRLQVRP